MSIESRLSQDLVEAMKIKDQVRVVTLRAVKAALTLRSIETKKQSLSDDEILTVIQKQVKQRKESYSVFKEAGREDLAENELKEIRVLETYLPNQLSDSELRKIIHEVIDSMQAKTKADTGKVMKELMGRLKGQADGKSINLILSQLLQ